MANMKTLIKIVFIIFIANGIDCLGSNNYCSFSEYENITAESLVNYDWYNAKEDLILKIFEKNNNDVFTSKGNEDEILFKLDENDKLKITNQDETEDKLKLEDKKYALFEIKTETSKTVYLYCSDVESSKKKKGIFKGTDHISISVKACDTTNVMNMNGMFSECSNLEKLDLKNFNTENVTNMNNMFSESNNLTELDLKNFNTKTVTDMSYMFYFCNSLKNLDISNFNTTKVTNMAYMFYGCEILNELKFGQNFNTKKVNNMSYMFYFCSSLEKLDLKNFNTENVKDMSFMFSRCNKLTELDLKNFDTKKVTNMECMFYKCSNLEKIDLKNFNTEKVTDMGSMFFQCEKLTKLEFGKNFRTSNVLYKEDMFSGCSSFPEEIRSNLNDVEGIINFFKEKNN